MNQKKLELNVEKWKDRCAVVADEIDVDMILLFWPPSPDDDALTRIVGGEPRVGWSVTYIKRTGNYRLGQTTRELRIHGVIHNAEEAARFEQEVMEFFK